MLLARRNANPNLDRPTWPAIIVLFSTLCMAGAAVAANATSAGDTELSTASMRTTTGRLPLAK